MENTDENFDFSDSENDLFEEDNFSDLNILISQEANTSSPQNNTSSPQNNYASRRKRSAIWPHFDTNTNTHPGVPVCRQCDTVFSSTTGVSTLRRHLNSHNISAPARRQTTLPFSRIPRTDPYNEEEQKKRDKKLITWVIADQQPFTVVENQYFNDFIKFLDPRYITPTRQAAKKMIINEFENRRVKTGLEIIDSSVEKGIPYLKPELDVDTRCNSTYYMLQKMQKMETALRLLAADHPSIHALYPTINEQLSLKDVLTLLEPIEAATKLLSAISYPTISDIRLVFLSIQDFLDTYIEQDEFSQKMVAASIHQKIEEYWIIMNKSSVVSAVLDPRAKLKMFSKTEAIDAKKTVQEIMDQYVYKYQKTSISMNIKDNPIKTARKFFWNLRNK
ncbi:6021_t:CDS:2 [Cetraspora pellucida]|uniref:6021_t:CDS:1 n=1 Tax=Cetraspora pellucida TaxID=1433469 RepID=A0ACA9LTZ6_9GLOM|nr:6021_t:CDS:2 [Cetraspora pellucida]